MCDHEWTDWLLVDQWVQHFSPVWEISSTIRMPWHLERKFMFPRWFFRLWLWWSPGFYSNTPMRLTCFWLKYFTDYSMDCHEICICSWPLEKEFSDPWLFPKCHHSAKGSLCPVFDWNSLKPLPFREMLSTFTYEGQPLNFIIRSFSKSWVTFAWKSNSSLTKLSLYSNKLD